MVASSRIAVMASAFAIGASAAVINRRQQEDNGWLATDYQWGCSPGGCSSRFNLLGFAGVPSGAPAFDVVCSPIYIQQDWIACKNRDGSTMAPESVVYAVWQAGPDNAKQYINIAHIYYRQEDGLYYDAESTSDGFLPEKGATERFTIAKINPASASHLPPVVNSDAATGIPDMVKAENPAATSAVPAAGEDTPTPTDESTPAADPTATESFTPAVDPTPTGDSEDPTFESAPINPVPSGDVPSNTLTEGMPDGLILSQPLQSDAVLSQPLLDPVPGTGTIGVGR